MIINSVLRRCESMNRLLLTGTPLQNNLAELWSLLNFLLPEIFDDLAVFESWFDAKELQQGGSTQKVLKQEEEKQVLSTLREILKPFMLRRVKSDVCLDVPPKKELIVYAPMTELQHDLYLAILKRDLHVLSRIEKETYDDGPTRPKRRCTANNKYSSNYVDIYDAPRSGSSGPSTPMSEENDAYDWNVHPTETKNQALNQSSVDRHLDVWRQYADVNARNVDFFIRVRFGNSGKNIVILAL